VCLNIFKILPSTKKKHGKYSPLTKFLKFAEKYLQLVSPVLTNQTQPLRVDNDGEFDGDYLCEKCELSVVNSICKVYEELFSAQLRLASELKNLGKLLSNSKPKTWILRTG